MSPARKHRGPAPKDTQLFGGDVLPHLQAATHDLSWLLTRSYPEDAALKLVGDRYKLRARQRQAVRRCACSDQAFKRRQRNRASLSALRDTVVWVDGFNCLIGAETLLAGGIVMRTREGATRDLAGVYANYRIVHETEQAFLHIGKLLEGHRPAKVTWLFDRPVSNSGRVARMALQLSEHYNWQWGAETSPHVDDELAAAAGLVATGDSSLLERCHWVDLVGGVLPNVPTRWVLDLQLTHRSTAV